MNAKATRGRGKRIAWIIAGSVLALVLAVHLFLPSLLLRAVNRGLAGIPGYRAHVEDVDVSLLRGAYAVNGVVFEKLEGGDALPVFTARRADFSVEWSALLRGKIVSEIGLLEPRLNILPGPSGDTASFDFAALRRAVEGFFPFTINRFDIEDGAVRFIDSSRSPPVDLRIDAIHATAKGLTNAQEAPKETPAEGTRIGTDKTGDHEPGSDRKALPASFRLTARAMGHAPLAVNLAMAPLAERPTFDVNAELTGLDLTTLNPFFRAYANVDVEQGEFSLYTEIAAADGGFRGYAKPLTKNLRILDPDGDEGGVLGTAWEALVAGVAKLLENPPEEQVGTIIRFRGTFDRAQTDPWSTVAWLLRNAFIRALQPGIENSIRLEGGPTLEEEKSQEKKEAERS